MMRLTETIEALLDADPLLDVDAKLETFANLIQHLRWAWCNIDEDCPHIDEHTARVRSLASMFFDIIEREATELSELVHKTRVASSNVRVAE